MLNVSSLKEERVEKPRMDRDIHLLMLMQRQLEEARGLGLEDPQLEYREQPSMLRTWVAEAESVEEVEMGGYHHGDDLIEGAGDQLRRLVAEGYAVIEPDESEPQSGVVSTTGKALQKIRQRQAFESNFPRRLTMPEFSLFGGLRVGVMKLWRADWEGHVIRVRNRWYLVSPKKASGFEITAVDSTEGLDIDGRPAHIRLSHLPETERPLPRSMRHSQSRRSKDLYGELRAADGVHEVHAHIGLTAPFRTTGCLIAVDGVVIGGDVSKEFVT